MQDFDEWADPGFVLPVRGTAVRIPSPTAREGLRLRRLMVDLAALTPEVEAAEGRRLTAPVREQLDALGVDRGALVLIGRAALLHFGRSAAAGAAYWNGELGAAPEPPPPEDPSAPGYLGADDPGGGPIDAVTGLRYWYNPPSATAAAGPSMSWADVLACWPQIVLDMHTVYGVDIDSGVLDERPWCWLELRIRDLAVSPGTRLHRAVFPPTPPT
ncbi:DUF7426 family protein [Nocardia salmonicida]|uniref:DUF7426 family protein n=1 Tax=Nocardia salmonicida TaxID=53431 RepID=UPI003628B0E3